MVFEPRPVLPPLHPTTPSVLWKLYSDEYGQEDKDSLFPQFPACGYSFILRRARLQCFSSPVLKNHYYWWVWMREPAALSPYLYGGSSTPADLPQLIHQVEVPCTKRKVRRQEVTTPPKVSLQTKSAAPPPGEKGHCPHSSFNAITQILPGEETGQRKKSSTVLPEGIDFIWKRMWRSPCLSVLLTNQEILVKGNGECAGSSGILVTASETVSD